MAEETLGQNSHFFLRTKISKISLGGNNFKSKRLRNTALLVRSEREGLFPFPGRVALTISSGCSQTRENPQAGLAPCLTSCYHSYWSFLYRLCRLREVMSTPFAHLESLSSKISHPEWLDRLTITKQTEAWCSEHTCKPSKPMPGTEE